MTATLFPTEPELDEIIVGPELVALRIASDARLNLVMLYPLLLQVAHPTVSAGVIDFSGFEQRPWDRLLRTLDYVSLLVYGGQDAVAVGRRLRAMHRRFRGLHGDGGRYSALEPGAYAWVHATLLQSYVAGHAHFGRRLSGAEVERFYREYRGLGRLIGVRERDLPPDWRGFCEYFAATAEQELTRTEAVKRVLSTVHGVSPPPLPVPGWVWRAIRVPARHAVWLGGVGLLGASLRHRLGIRWTPLDAAQFRAMGVLRPLTPLMPSALSTTGPGQLRWRRGEIAFGPLGAGQAVAFTARGE